MFSYMQESQHNDNDKEVLYGEAAVPEFEEIRPDDGLPGVLIQESQHNDNDKEVLYGEAFEGDMLMSKEDLEEFYGIRQSEKSENVSVSQIDI